ncbi:KPN_02809 family neutral zinc metallopeptidase [Kytococcus sp. Marseille-QA3725]
MTFNDNANLDTSQVSGGGGGGMGRGAMIGGGGGIGGLLLILLLVLTGNGDLLTGGGGGGQQQGQGGQNQQQGQDPWGFGGGSTETTGDTGDFGNGQGDFSHCRTGKDANEHTDCRVIGTVNSVQQYWQKELPKVTNPSKEYRKSTTVIYNGQTQSQCGTASNEVGPFYCPLDEKIFIDPAFFSELDKFGVENPEEKNLAQMYIVAHEYGHHVQNILGYLVESQKDPKGEKSGAVRTELMADCLAGAWVANADGTTDSQGTPLIKKVTQQQINDALEAAAAVGDDNIQQRSGRGVNPEAFTHGTSEQRQKWFMAGYEGGSAKSCDTFRSENL